MYKGRISQQNSDRSRNCQGKKVNEKIMLMVGAKHKIKEIQTNKDLYLNLHSTLHPHHPGKTLE